MIVGVLVIDLHLPGSQSLKDKRQVARHLKDRIKNRFNVSLCETEGQNTWQHCQLAVAMAAMSQAPIERDFDRIMEFVESDPRVALTEHWTEFY